MPGPRYSHEGFARRGQELYDRKKPPTLQPADENKFVAIDIESADYELDEDDRTAGDRLLGRQPDAQMWLMRVGHRTAYRIGGRFLGRPIT